MKNILDFLNRNSAAMTVLLTMALVIVTAWYVWLTHRLVIQQRYALLLAYNPALSLKVGPYPDNPDQTVLYVENHGSGTAFATMLFRFTILTQRQWFFARSYTMTRCECRYIGDVLVGARSQVVFPQADLDDRGVYFAAMITSSVGTRHFEYYQLPQSGVGMLVPASPPHSRRLVHRLTKCSKEVDKLCTDCSPSGPLRSV